MEKITALLALHNPQAVACDMVYEVWEDGEVTLTKGAELYGMRNLHTIELGEPSKAVDFNLLPVKNSRHGCIQVMTAEDVDKARAIIFS